MEVWTERLKQFLFLNTWAGLQFSRTLRNEVQIQTINKEISANTSRTDKCKHREPRTVCEHKTAQQKEVDNEVLNFSRLTKEKKKTKQNMFVKNKIVKEIILSDTNHWRYRHVGWTIKLGKEGRRRRSSLAAVHSLIHPFSFPWSPESSGQEE